MNLSLFLCLLPKRQVTGKIGLEQDERFPTMCSRPIPAPQGFRQGGPGGTMDPPNIFPRKIRIFTGVWGGPWSPPRKMGFWRL